MNKTKILTLDKERILFLTQLVILVGVATLAPLFGHQAITGPLVNATLFVSTILLGVQAGILVGLIPSLIALSTGLLPPVLAPMIPFIMVGNTILVIAFNYLKDNYWLGVVVAGTLKFFFLFSSSMTVVGLFSKREVAQRIVLMMGWSQLFTALVGGLLAYFFLKKINRL